MTHAGTSGEPTTLPPDDAFAVLGNDTRIQILRTLGEADGPLSFTEVRERVGIAQGGQFNYHLDKVVGHFVEKTDAGYELRQAGRRVIYAVLSAAVTDAEARERTGIDHACPYCEAPVEVRYHEGHVEMFCTGCAGMTGTEEREQGYLGCLALPPAGLQGRSIAEAFRIAFVWNRLDVFAIASGFCPHCSAALDDWLDVCENHAGDDDLCGTCGSRHAITFNFECTNCIYDGSGTVELGLASNTDLLAFLTARGLNPTTVAQLAPLERTLNDCTEAVRSTDPFEADVTFTVDGDALTLTVDADLDVVDVTVTGDHPSPDRAVGRRES